MNFSCLIWFISLYFVVGSQLVCPGGGLLDNFNQDINVAKKCFFVVEVKSNQRGNPIKDGNEDCVAFGGSSAKLAVPENPTENEILRFLLNEGTTNERFDALIGTEVKEITLGGNNNWNIKFIYKGKEVVDDYKGPYDTRYNNHVGEVGIYYDGLYSYFLHHPGDDDLTKYVGQDNLCVTMTSTYGSWRIRFCNKIPGNRIMCQSDVFKSCDLPEQVNTTCTYNKDLKACTKQIYVPLQAKCPPNIPATIFCESCERPCEHSDWAEWTTCLGDCKSQTKIKFKVAINPSDTCKDQIEYECSPAKCEPICDVGQWSAWSDCSATCGEQVSTRIRTSTYIVDKDKEYCDALKSDTKSCNDKPPCVQHCIQNIGQWSGCSASCGLTGTRKRTISPHTSVSGNGLPCEKLDEEENCPNDKICPIDCVYTDWTISSPCSVTCDNGTFQETREIKKDASRGGLPCSGEKTRNVTCVNVPCVTNCTLGNWETWRECSVTCGQGTKMRKKSIKIQNSYWGYPCKDEIEKIICSSGIVCPIQTEIQNETNEYSLENKIEDKPLTVFYAIIIVIAVVILLSLCVAAVCIVCRSSRNDVKKPHQAVKQAMKDVLGSKKPKKTSKFVGKRRK